MLLVDAMLALAYSWRVGKKTERLGSLGQKRRGRGDWGKRREQGVKAAPTI
jgi:hypothetical protein